MSQPFDASPSRGVGIEACPLTNLGQRVGCDFDESLLAIRTTGGTRENDPKNEGRKQGKRESCRIVRLNRRKEGRSAIEVGRPPKEQEKNHLVDQIREIVTSPYLALVVGVAILATFGKYFVDFAFLEHVGSLSKGDKELASFLGIFSGATQTLSLLTGILVSRPLLDRFGIRVGVMILPFLHALCTVVIVVVGLLGIAPQLTFWLVIANQGIYKAFKHPIDNASFKVLYQPLRIEQRLAVQIAVEVIFSPVVVGLSGAIMLVQRGPARCQSRHANTCVPTMTGFPSRSNEVRDSG